MKILLPKLKPDQRHKQKLNPGDTFTFEALGDGVRIDHDGIEVILAKGETFIITATRHTIIEVSREDK